MNKQHPHSIHSQQQPIEMKLMNDNNSHNHITIIFITIIIINIIIIIVAVAARYVIVEGVVAANIALG